MFYNKANIALKHNEILAFANSKQLALFLTLKKIKPFVNKENMKKVRNLK
jgi:hypothetical protein